MTEKKKRNEMIRELVKAGQPLKNVAAAFGISKARANQIANPKLAERIRRASLKELRLHEFARRVMRKLPFDDERAIDLRKWMHRMTLDADDLDTILTCIKNEQPGRITPSELRELLRVWENAGHVGPGSVEEMVHFYATQLPK